MAQLRRLVEILPAAAIPQQAFHAVRWRLTASPAAIVATAMCLFSAAAAQDAADDGPPQRPYPPARAAATMETPRGFDVQLFAAEPDVRQPIGFCVDDRARLWVAEAYNYPRHGERPGDRIVILEDVDGDGRMDRRKVFYDQLNYVTGIEVGFGGVWVVSPPYFYFIPDRDQNDEPDGEPTVLLDGFGNHANSHNLANGLAWGPDGWLYGTHGRTNWSLLGKPGAKAEDRVRFDGGVYRYHPLRHVWEPYADGTTNPWGIDWNDYGEAFTTNCVNPHLFHVLPGAHYEPWRNRKSSEFAYERVPTIADHLHFTGLGNVRDGLGSEAEDAAGGGHAHCGTLIYLGENWPARYRNSLLTNNIHGKRINNDLLRRKGSTYTASHGPDLLRAADPWFVGVTLAAGPAGEVYVSDWSDVGECHYVRNTRKETGRIFRITYGDLKRPAVDLGQAASVELARMHASSNEWMVRHARRILMERQASGDSLDKALELLTQQLASNTASAPQKLRALWTLHALERLPRETLLEWTRFVSAADESADSGDEDDSQYLRSWAVRLLAERGSLAPDELTRLRRMAAEDQAALVQLYLASVTQRLPPGQAWPILEALAAREIDPEDKTLQLMIWYGVEPLVEDDLERFAALARTAKAPLLRRHAARRLASLRSSEGAQGLAAVVQAMSDADEADVVADMLEGVLLGLQGRRRLPPPPAWRRLFQRWVAADPPSQPLEDRLLRLALIFDDPEALARLKTLAQQDDAPAARRTSALASLIQRRDESLAELLLGLLDDREVQGTAIRGLAAVNDERVAEALLSAYPQFSAEAKQDALQTLASRTDWATRLLDAMEAGVVPATDVTAYTARSLTSLDAADVRDRLQRLWGEIRATPADRERLIRDYRRKLHPQTLAGADVRAGRQLFQKHCAACHKLFGQGGSVGPDLSGAQRSNVDYLLENLLDPSASVAKAYRMEVFRLEDGRVVTGIVETENDATVSVFTVNERLVLDQHEITARRGSSLSIMPDGMLRQLTDRQVRDLMGYLQSASP